MKFRNRVYGVSAIRSINSNWNADFTGNPKTLSTGEIFGSDKAFKYPIKKMWENEGKKIMYVKSYKTEKGKLQPVEPIEKYKNLFKVELGDKTEPKEALKNLFSAEDILNFGATFAAKKQNISITGAVQVMQGENVYDETNVEVQDILSPFRNSNKDEAEASSKGTKITVDEAHYLYGFSINPQNYDIYNDVIDDFEGYTVEAYENFKRGCKVGATYLNTNSKSGCENEFALFVKLKENSLRYLPSFTEYIKFYKEDEKAVYDLTMLGEFLDKFKDDIESVEVYANTFIVKVITGNIECNVMDIFE